MDLSSVLPSYYDDNETMQELQGILSAVTEELEGGLQKTVDDSFWSGASGNDMLSRYEKMFGLSSDTDKSDRYRRERISARVAGAGTTTASLIQHIAESYTNAEVELIENFPEYIVTIRFIGTSGIPGNISDIKASIEEAIPAHLKVVYEYIFNTYGSVGTFTHGQLSAYTHYKIRNGHLKTRAMELAAYQYKELGQLTHEQITRGDLPNGN